MPGESTAIQAKIGGSERYAVVYFQSVPALECPGCADKSDVVGILVTDWTSLDFFVKRRAFKAVKQLPFGAQAVSANQGQ